MGANVLTQDGKQAPIVMGSYGIGVERIISATVEQQHDEDGILWPSSLAPFAVVITITNMKQDDLPKAAEKLYQDLQQAGFEVLLDDRDERAGVKFKDADLIGIPYRVTIGKKVAEGMVELFDRRTKQSEDVKITDVVTHLQRLTFVQP
jgi:prolyl-tRNA synthetase